MHHTFHTFNLQKVLPLRSSHHSPGVVLSHRSNMAFTTRETGEWSGWSAVSLQIKSTLRSKIPHPQRVVSIPFTNQPQTCFCSTCHFNPVLIAIPHSHPPSPPYPNHLMPLWWFSSQRVPQQLYRPRLQQSCPKWPPAPRPIPTRPRPGELGEKLRRFGHPELGSGRSGGVGLEMLSYLYRWLWGSSKNQKKSCR